MPISRNLQKRYEALPLTQHPVTKDDVIADFAILIEMHQDKDGAIQTFRHAFVRGECAPIKVHFDPNGMDLENDAGDIISLAPDAQKFMTIEAWSLFVMNYIMETGDSPIQNGTMPTRLLRDARQKRNLLQSFRQIVNHHARKGGGTGSHP